MAHVWPDLREVHVVVVDDHEDTVDVFRQALEFSGATVTAFQAAVPAMEFVATLRPDVVVTDIAMPAEDGLWLLRQLEAVVPGVPVIAVTGRDVHVTPDAKFARLFHKPVDPFVICKEIERLLGRSR